MTDEYKASYLILFNAVTDALEAMNAKNCDEAETILVQAQKAAEEAFIRQGEQ